MSREVRRLREMIDEVDLRILELLNRRVALSLEMGRAKKSSGWPVHDPSRERFILEKVRAGARDALAEETLRRIYERILDESRRLSRLAREGAGTPAGEDPA